MVGCTFPNRRCHPWELENHFLLTSCLLFSIPVVLKLWFQTGSTSITRELVRPANSRASPWTCGIRNPGGRAPLIACQQVPQVILVFENLWSPDIIDDVNRQDHKTKKNNNNKITNRKIGVVFTSHYFPSSTILNNY